MKKILYALLLAMAAFGCSKEDILSVDDSANGEATEYVEFTLGGITRGDDMLSIITDFSNSDSFAIFSSEDLLHPKRYIIDSQSGVIKSEDGDIGFETKPGVKYIAFYPYRDNDEENGFTYFDYMAKANTNFNTTDYLSSNTSGEFSASTTLIFGHFTSILNIKITSDNSTLSATLDKFIITYNRVTTELESTTSIESETNSFPIAFAPGEELPKDFKIQILYSSNESYSNKYIYEIDYNSLKDLIGVDGFKQGYEYVYFVNLKVTNGDF